MVVRFLLWVVLALLLRFVFRSLARATASLAAPGERGSPTVYKGLMVRDPICGLHIPQSRALVESRGRERIHFCSEACLAAFRNSGA
ncbi:MAG: hypothetical protein ACRD21_00735 [Vicinamibacteria bacterium]